MKKALTYFIFFLALQVVGGVLGMLLKQSGLTNDDSSSIFVASIVSSLAAMILFLITEWCPLNFLKIRKSLLASLSITIPLALSLITPLAWIEEFIPEQLTKDVNEEVFKMLLGSIEGYIIIGLMAPLCEEIVFRGAILNTLLKKFTGRPWIAIAISALLFAVAHFNPAQTPHAIIVGLLLGWMFYRTGSILPGIVFHWVNNTVPFLLFACYPELPYNAKLTDFFGESIHLLPYVIVFSLVVGGILLTLFYRTTSKNS